MGAVSIRYKTRRALDGSDGRRREARAASVSIRYKLRGALDGFSRKRR